MPFEFNRNQESRIRILKAIAPLNTFTHNEVLHLVALQEQVDTRTLESLWLFQIIADQPTLVDFNKDKNEYSISKLGRELLEETTTDLDWEHTADEWAVPYYSALMAQFSMSEPNDVQKLIYFRAEKNLKFHKDRLG